MTLSTRQAATTYPPPLNRQGEPWLPAWDDPLGPDGWAMRGRWRREYGWRLNLDGPGQTPLFPEDREGRVTEHGQALLAAKADMADA
jgi:hypothetical protein